MLTVIPVVTCIQRLTRSAISGLVADAQIAYLFKQGLVDFAISEDSDLIVYGVKVLVKLNKYAICCCITATGVC